MVKVSWKMDEKQGCETRLARSLYDFNLYYGFLEIHYIILLCVVLRIFNLAKTCV